MTNARIGPHPKTQLLGIAYQTSWVWDWFCSQPPDWLDFEIQTCDWSIWFFFNKLHACDWSNRKEIGISFQIDQIHNWSSTSDKLRKSSESDKPHYISHQLYKWSYIFEESGPVFTKKPKTRIRLRIKLINLNWNDLIKNIVNLMKFLPYFREGKM